MRTCQEATVRRGQAGSVFRIREVQGQGQLASERSRAIRMKRGGVGGGSALASTGHGHVVCQGSASLKGVMWEKQQ